jgi:hypothetical protein
MSSGSPPRNSGLLWQEQYVAAAAAPSMGVGVSRFRTPPSPTRPWKQAGGDLGTELCRS